MRNLIIIFFCTIFSVQIFANQANLEVVFKKANDAYTSGQFADALEDYQSILNLGFESTSLFYNIGNCHYKTGDFPSAILYFEKALKSDPSNEDIRFNLKLANLKIVDKIDVLPVSPISEWWNKLVFAKSSTTWGWLTIQGFFLFALLLGAFVKTKSVNLKKLFFYGSMLILVLSLFFFTFGYQQKSNLNENKYAIVMTPSLVVFSAPDANGTKLFTIHEGTKIQELENMAGWVKIKLVNGNVGWAQESALRTI
jgi:tetratricopeptide (TPR) repeat protein